MIWMLCLSLSLNVVLVVIVCVLEGALCDARDTIAVHEDSIETLSRTLSESKSEEWIR
jgi:hypothetical protein